MVEHLANAPWALLGGAMIGLASALVLWLHGQILGISGLIAALLQPWDADDRWRASLLLGVFASGAMAIGGDVVVFESLPNRPLWLLASGGFLVGFGTRLGNGCTSGHGVCGVSRLSPRSLIATAVFIGAGAATVALVRAVL